MSVRELRAALADVLNEASTRDQVMFVTNHGRRVAAVVSVAVGENAAMETRAQDDGTTAMLYATNLGIIEERNGIPGRTMAEVFEEYASDLLSEFGGSAKRTLAAARAVAARLPDEVGYPARWRYASLAVELCQRAAEIADGDLPGTYRPGSRSSPVRR
jgi:prevent-host-death family protein